MGPVTLAVWVEQVVVEFPVEQVAGHFPVEQAVVGVVEFPVAVAVVVRQSCVLPQELSRRWRADGHTIVLCTDP